MLATATSCETRREPKIQSEPVRDSLLPLTLRGGVITLPDGHPLCLPATLKLETELWQLDAHLLLTASDRPAELLVGGFINMPLGEIVALVGDSDVGKSWLAMELAVALSLGEPFLGQPTKKVNTLYLSFESGLDRDRDRIRRLANGYGVSMQTLTESFGYKNLTANAGRLLSEDVVSALEEIIAYFDPKCIVIDAFSAASNVDSNKEEDVQRVYSLLKRLSRGERTIVVLAHPSRQGRSRNSKEMEASGSVQHRAQARVVYTLRSEGSDRDGQVLTFGISKANDGELTSKSIRRLGTFGDPWLRHELIDDQPKSAGELPAPLTFSCDISTAPTFSERQRAILSILQKGQLSSGELANRLADALGVTESYVKNWLTKEIDPLTGRGKDKPVRKRKRGREVWYSLKYD